VRLSFERKPGGRDRVTDPLAEAIDCERLTVLGIDNGHVVARAPGAAGAVGAGVAAPSLAGRSDPGGPGDRPGDTVSGSTD
jgi:hypothetical protein